MENNKLGVSVGERLHRIRSESEHDYVFHSFWQGDRAWLVWPLHASMEEVERLFPLVNDFDFHANLRAPSVAFMSRYPRHSANRDERLEQIKDNKEKLKTLGKKYQGRDGYIDEAWLPALKSRRDSLRGQVRDAGQRLRDGPLQEIRLLLIVWLIEARREGSNRTGREAHLARVSPQYHVVGLWEAINRGERTEELNKREGWLHKLLDHGDEVLARAQRDQIIEVLKDRDHILEETAPVREKLRICETILQKALDDEPIPPFETFRDAISKEEQLGHFEHVAHSVSGDDSVHVSETTDEYNGMPFSYVLTEKRELLEYAKHLHEKYENWSLKKVHSHLVKKAESIPVAVLYQSFSSFKRTYYEFH